MDENLRRRKNAAMFKQERVSLVNCFNLIVPLHRRNKHYTLAYCKTLKRNTYIVKEKKSTSER